MDGSMCIKLWAVQGKKNILTWNTMCTTENLNNSKSGQSHFFYKLIEVVKFKIVEVKSDQKIERIFSNTLSCRLNSTHLHLYGDVEHETWFSGMSHAHHSDPIGVAHTHLLQIQTGAT